MLGKLAEKDRELLMRKTKFTEDDILEWFAVFKTECPDGLLHKQTVTQIFKGKDMSCLVLINLPTQTYWSMPSSDPLTPWPTMVA